MRKTISVDNQTKDRIDYVARTLNKSRRALMREVFGSLFELLSSFESANIWYDLEITKGRLTLTCVGSRNLIVGSKLVTDSVTDSEAIQEIRGS